MTPAQQINGALRRVPTWPIYLFGLVMPGWLLWQGATGGLGVEPIEALEHRLGELALQTLIVTLLVTPVRDLLGVNLIRFRRALGLVAFLFVWLHFLVWLVLDVQIPSEIWADIIKRPYVTVGFAAFLLLIPLAATSNNLSIRKLGPLRWRRLHRLTYPAAILAGAHFVMLAKGFQIEPLVYAAIIGALLLYRVPFGGLARQRT